MVMGGPPVSRRVPMTTGRPRGDRRVPTVSPWRQEDLMVTGGPPLSRRVPMVSALSPQCQEDPTVSVLSPKCQEDLTVTEGSPWCPHSGGRTSQ